MHRSVYEQFDLGAVPIYDEMRPYRPEALATHDDFAAYYELDAPFPAQSLENATTMADDPAVIAAKLRDGAKALS